VATRLLAPGRELEVLRALQLAWFNTTLLLDEDKDIALALAPAEDPLLALGEFPAGLVTQEVAAIMAQNNGPVDRAAAERALIELAAEGRVRRTVIGDDAPWQAV
jgi:hypothetical protein